MPGTDSTTTMRLAVVSQIEMNPIPGRSQQPQEAAPPSYTEASAQTIQELQEELSKSRDKHNEDMTKLSTRLGAWLVVCTGLVLLSTGLAVDTGLYASWYNQERVRADGTGNTATITVKEQVPTIVGCTPTESAFMPIESASGAQITAGILARFDDHPTLEIATNDGSTT